VPNFITTCTRIGYNLAKVTLYRKLQVLLTKMEVNKTMKKRLILESTAIALLIMVLTLTPAFASWPGPDLSFKTDYGDYGSWVYANVGGYYCEEFPGQPSSMYCREGYGSGRGSNAEASVCGNMYHISWAGSAWKQGSTPLNNWMNLESVICDSAAQFTVSEFEYLGNNWYVDEFAYVVASAD
jgi:hypothetical protein